MCLFLSFLICLFVNVGGSMYESSWVSFFWLLWWIVMFVWMENWVWGFVCKWGGLWFVGLSDFFCVFLINYVLLEEMVWFLLLFFVRYLDCLRMWSIFFFIWIESVLIFVLVGGGIVWKVGGFCFLCLENMLLGISMCMCGKIVSVFVLFLDILFLFG